MNHSLRAFYESSCTDRKFNDYLLLGGGTDINPKIYGQTNFGMCQSPHDARDARNIEAINEYVEMGKPIFGICRGMQLLDAVFGGQLIQHTVGHPNGVTVRTKRWDDNPYCATFSNCRNCHHQVVNEEHTKGIIIGWSEYQYKAYFGLDSRDSHTCDIVPQIIYWEDKKALAVQFHPEWHDVNHKMNVYLRGLIKELLGLENVL